MRSRGSVENRSPGWESPASLPHAEIAPGKSIAPAAVVTERFRKNRRVVSKAAPV